jgi:Family of unknown function (DUF5647)
MSVSQAFVKKNIKLHLEFDKVLFADFELLDQIPNGAHLIMTVEGDEKFNAVSRSLVKNVKPSKVVEAHKARGTWSLQPLRLQAA